MSSLNKKLIDFKSTPYFKNSLKSKSIIKSFPIIYQHKKNKFKNIFTWYQEYSEDLKKLYYFIYQFKKKNTIIADQLVFIDFCVFCWNHSDLSLPYSF